MTVAFTDTEAADYETHVADHFVKFQINGKDVQTNDLGGSGNVRSLIANDASVLMSACHVGTNEIAAIFDDCDEPVVTTLIVYDENGSSEDQSASPDSTPDSTPDSSTKDSSTTSPKTGDASNLYLWLIITLASMAGVVGVLYTAKRKGIFTK